MDQQDEFYIGYSEETPAKTKRSVRIFVVAGLIILGLIATVFAISQNPFKNATFELTTATKITGVYHELPYPMLKVKTGEDSFKNILLIGFGKSGANPYLDKIREEEPNLTGYQLSIEGNLIYYNGQTLLQITDEEKVSLLESVDRSLLPRFRGLAKEILLKGEIIDPKCYFGVMKPGYGKIHRSCAVRCISGGIPPMLATTDANNISAYYLITDSKGNALHSEVLPYVGKPSEIKGSVVQMEDWYQLRIDIESIRELGEPSRIYQ